MGDTAPESLPDKSDLPFHDTGSGDRGIRDLIFKLEEESQQKHQRQVVAMQEQILMRDQQVETLKAAIERLKEDFEYNLTLIAARDDELTQYDATLADLQKVVRERDVQVSEAKIEVANAESELDLAKSHVREKDAQIESLRHDITNRSQAAQFNMEEALRRQQESFDRVRYEYERKLEASASEIKRQ
eukprot:COSAG05_NODE_8706_length_679_cov_0.767241_2_plen_187_part_01